MPGHIVFVFSCCELVIVFIKYLVLRYNKSTDEVTTSCSLIQEQKYVHMHEFAGYNKCTDLLSIPLVQQ